MRWLLRPGMRRWGRCILVSLRTSQCSHSKRLVRAQEVVEGRGPMVEEAKTNSAPPSAWLACGSRRASARRYTTCWPWSTAGSPRGLTWPICRKRKHYSKSLRNGGETIALSVGFRSNDCHTPTTFHKVDGDAVGALSVPVAYCFRDYKRLGF